MPGTPPVMAVPPDKEAARRAQIEQVQKELRRQLDYGYRKSTPGYPEYASQARKDLFPSGAHLASTSGIPILSDAADAALTLDALKRKEYEEAAINAAFTMIPFLGAGVLRATKTPEATVPAYRAHRVFGPRSEKYGHLYPAMIGKDTKMETALSQQLPVGEWLKSELIPFTMAERQGWHAGAMPYGEQFNVSRNGGRTKADKIYQPDDVVYTEVDLGAENDYSRFLDPNSETVIYDPQIALPFDQTKLPEGGFYLYQNPGTPYPWYVSDYVKHNRILTDEEIADIHRSAGLPVPPPRKSGKPVTEARLRELGLL